MSVTFLVCLALVVGTGAGSHADPPRDSGEAPVSPLPASIHPLADLQAEKSESDTAVSHWILSPQGSEARYRVREQLAGFDFPNDAVGITNEFTGTIAFGADGEIVAGSSEVRVQLASLATDNERRDGYVRRRILEVDQYPEAVLEPRRFIGFDGPPPHSGSASFQLEADLTLHGRTQATVWEVTAEFGPETLTGLATTAFTFDTFGIAKPQVARVLSVDDNIRLELQFRFDREG